MANKKTFDREKMYRKIMPTYYDNNFALAPEDESEVSEFAVDEFETTQDTFDAEPAETGFEEISEIAENTVVDFPTRKKEPVSKETADVKSAIKQAVNDTVANLSKTVDEPEPPMADEPRAVYGTYAEPAATNAAHMRTAEIERIREQHSKIAIYNLTEKVILEKLDVVMENMNCCRCDRCKMDVVALTLNNMEPYYVVRAQDSPDYTKLEKEIADKATKAVLKSAIKVRKNPRH